MVMVSPAGPVPKNSGLVVFMVSLFSGLVILRVFSLGSGRA